LKAYSNLTINYKQIKTLGKFLGLSGERGIRTPGGVTLNGFQDRRIRPLCHFSRRANIKSNFLKHNLY
tara:strand:- start:463 stop:666 length:204 start_codon:yes stop_codon:yes gene_type:complete